MKIKKISLLLAIIVGAGMLVTGTASAAPDDLFFEIQVGGKGYQADTDDNTADPILYDEIKHKQETQTLYAWYDRANRIMHFAYYDEAGDTWHDISMEVVETEKNLFIYCSCGLSLYVDADGDTLSSTGNIIVQFKEQDGTFKNAKMKPIAMNYRQYKVDGLATTQLFGALKLKGKMVNPYDVMPAAVLVLFGLPL